MSDTNNVSQNNPDVAVPRFRDAYQRLLDEIRSLPQSELTPINIDIPSAVATALGALPEIMALRPQIVSGMPDFDIARLDKLEAYTLAVGHAHVMFQAASAPMESLEQLSTEAAALREVLLSDASALAKRNLVDGQPLGELKGPVGFRNLAFDVLTLSQLVRGSWAAVAGKTALQLADLDRAEMLGDRLITAVGLREQGPAIVAEAQAIRHRAFSLFVSAYDHARRAVSFLRWNEGDADEIAPSLYAGRNTGKRKSGTDTQPAVPTAPASPVVPAVPVAAPVAGGPVTNAHVATRSVGLPDSEPFVAR